MKISKFFRFLRTLIKGVNNQTKLFYGNEAD